jgi:hypothetical protein
LGYTRRNRKAEGQEEEMKKVFELLELLGFEINKETWYEEEGIEGTRVIAPDGKEYTVYGWGDDCEIDELIENARKKQRG